MFDSVARDAISLGITGLLFVMWWYERQERVRSAAGLTEALQYTRQTADVNEHLLSVVRANTEAVAALREELRSHRGVESEWLGRLSRQLERLTES